MRDRLRYGLQQLASGDVMSEYVPKVAQSLLDIMNNEQLVYVTPEFLDSITEALKHFHKKHSLPLPCCPGIQEAPSQVTNAMENGSG